MFGQNWHNKINFLKFTFTRSWEKGENCSKKIHHLYKIINNTRCPSQKGKLFPFQQKNTPFTVEHQEVTLYTRLSRCHNFKLSNLCSPEYQRQCTKKLHVSFMHVIPDWLQQQDFQSHLWVKCRRWRHLKMCTFLSE